MLKGRWRRLNYSRVPTQWKVLAGVGAQSAEIYLGLGGRWLGGAGDAPGLYRGAHRRVDPMAKKATKATSTPTAVATSRTTPAGVGRARRRPGRPVDGDSEETRRQLLAAAVHCFARKGLSRTTLREVAETAGLTTGTLYHHYSTKEALYTAAYVSVVEELYDEFKIVLDRHRDVRTRLVKLIAMAREHARTRPDRMSFILRAWVEHESDAVPLPVPQRVTDFMDRLGSDAVAEGAIAPGDRAHLANVLRSAFWGIACISLTGVENAASAARGLERLFAGELLASAPQSATRSRRGRRTD